MIRQGKSAFSPWVIPMAQNLEEILYNNKNRGSVAKTSEPSEETSTTLTPSVRITMEIAYNFWPEKKVRETQSQSILTNILPQNNTTYKTKVVVK